MTGSNGFAKGAADAKAAVFSLSGFELTPSEKSFFKESNPLGFILFKRNCDNPAQLRKLTEDLKETVGRACPILIDQEGGRVQRLRPPNWREYPAMRHFGEVAESDMDKALEDLRFSTLQLAEELVDGGINVSCAPVLDVTTKETHDVIGDRAFSEDVNIVARLGVSVARNLLYAGITPIIKHIPGHGRGKADSHHTLPQVTTQRTELEVLDFEPFRQFCQSDVASATWAMTAHIVYTEIDPELPATISPTVIEQVIRSHIGFGGLLLSDDLDMKALGAYGDAAACAGLALEAGCDIALYCSGVLKDMEKLVKSVPKLSKRALKCLQKAGEFRKLAA
jgi:beta-N-acetylhexosaminidase